MDPKYMQILLDTLHGREPFAQVTLIETTGSAPQETGARMMVRADGSIEGTVGGGAVEFRLIKEATEALQDGKSRLLHLDLSKDVGMCCGGAVRAFVEPVRLATPLVIFGCGHVCRALAPMVVRLGFALTVVDDRPEWADPLAFPEGTEVVCDSLESYCHKVEALERSFILVMTRSHSFDFQVLHHFVDRNPAYLGIMASKSKALRFRTDLEKEAGIAAELLDRVAMPVGLKIGSRTPEEIAVSVAAQLVQERRKLSNSGERA